MGQVKTKFLDFAIQNVKKGTQEWDHYVTKTVQKDIQTILLSATNQTVMEEEGDSSPNVKTVKNGDSYGSQNAKKIIMHSDAVFAMLNVQMACGILVLLATRKLRVVVWAILSLAEMIKTRSFCYVTLNVKREDMVSDQFAGAIVQKALANVELFASHQVRPAVI